MDHDEGKEFMEEEFQELLANYDIKNKHTAVKNLTSQALVECLHLLLGN